ncbi:MAG: serine/threonine protein kinase [bacterium]|nr:serine/threonine protein kinase [bacterium]
MKPLSERLTDKELIRRGDFTLAWRARDSVLDRPVFVKALNPALAADAEIRARFEREAKAVARLDHPNLVRIYEYGEDAEIGLYMLLELVEGTTLAARIADGERWTGQKWIELATQLLRGLAALHSVGILHRDLKPENILLRKQTSDSSQRNSLYKITDFSLAALRDAPKLTHHEAIVGTPAYMSPEQAAGGQPGERSDLFALGVVLYESAAGKNPFAGETVLETLHAIREQDIAAEQLAALDLAENGRALLAKLVQKDADMRCGSARDALALLGEKLPEPLSIYAPRSRKRNAIALSAAAIVIAIWAVLMFWRPSERPNASEATTMPADTTPLLVSISPAEESRSDSLNPAASKTEESRPVTKREERAEPEFRAPPEAKLPDSVNVWLFTEPWAHVFISGVQVGTTPLAAPLRVASGEQEIVLRNPAFPPIQTSFYLMETETRETVRLAEYVALVQVNVAPWGELFLDGETVGTTPLQKPLFVSPGTHALRISHPQLAAVQREFTAAASETLHVKVDLTRSEIVLSNGAKSHP